METQPFDPNAPQSAAPGPPGGYTPLPAGAPPGGGGAPLEPPVYAPGPPPGSLPPRQTNTVWIIAGLVAAGLVILCLCMVGGSLLAIYQINQQTSAIFSTIASALDASPGPFTPVP